MTTTPNLGITEVSASQSQKEVTINAALEALDKVVTDSLDVVCTAGGTIALTTGQSQQYMRYNLTGTPAAGFVFQFPASIKRLCVVRNASGKTATVRQTASPGRTVTLPTGQMVVVYVDGATNIDVVASGATAFTGLSDVPTAYTSQALKLVRVNAAANALEFGPQSTISVGAFQESAPTASQRVLRYVFVEAATFPANFAGSRGNIGVAPTASTTIDVQKNGTTIGSIVISTGSAFTFTTTTGSTKSFAVGDRLDFVAPASPDATAALIAVTLLANKD